MSRVAVIGAGPAGSIAAIILARAGIDVTLIEQHRFPRDKVCGECMSSVGVELLHRLRLSEHVENRHPARLTRTIIFGADGGRAEIPLPKPMWGISRVALDQLLLDAARDAGARILQPVRCERIESQLQIRNLESNQLTEIDAEFIVIADGKSAMMPQTPPATTDFGFKAHFVNLDAPPDAIVLYGVDGHYGGEAPIESGQWNIAFSVPKSRLQHFGRDYDALFAQIRNENLALRDQARNAKRTSDWLISPLPRFSIQDHWPARVIPIGNAAAALEPIGGEGMGLAMRSAELAANEIIRAIQNGCELNSAALRREYRKLWSLRSIACRLGARIISSPTFSRLAIPLAGSTDGPGALALRLVGK